MTYLKSVTAVALVSLAMGVTSAIAQEATGSACNEQSRKVTAALSANQQSAQYQDARHEADSGRDYCRAGFYKVGLDHYASALKLLGQT
jgi:hypothetical protein